MWKLTLGLVVGIILGWWLGPSTRVSERAEAAASAAPSVQPAAQAALAQAPTAALAASARPAVAQAGAPVSPAAVDVQRMSIEALRATVSQLQHELAVSHSRLEQAEGKPSTFRPDLDRRFKDPDVLRAGFTNALRQAGFAGAEVTDVDCTEYPCIVFGKGFGERGDGDKLRQAAGFAYAEDNLRVSGWQSQAASEHSVLFGVAVSPGDEKLTPDEVKRLRDRQQAWIDATKPQ